MDLTALKTFEDEAIKMIEKAKRLHELVLLRHLRIKLGISIDQTASEIMAEYRKEMKPKC